VTRQISMTTRKELVAALQLRYGSAAFGDLTRCTPTRDATMPIAVSRCCDAASRHVSLDVALRAARSSVVTAGLSREPTSGLPASANCVFGERALYTHVALLTLACVVICSRFVEQFC